MSDQTSSIPHEDGDFALSEKQINVFNDFGFLLIKGLFAKEIESIQVGFDEAFEQRPAQVIPDEDWLHHMANKEFDGVKRHFIEEFVEESPKLRWLLEDARIARICRGLLGEEHHFKASVGNRTNCNLNWHSDSYKSPLNTMNIKLMFYLDPLTASNGALRVLPGTNAWDETYAKTMRRTLLPMNRGVYGIKPWDVPAFVIETEPGDLVINNFRTMHASFHGRPGRRLMTLSYGQGSGQE